jgi:hypothetical protein
MRTLVSRLPYSVTLISLAAVFATVQPPVLGAEGNAPAKKASGRKGHRLPAHYAQVVNEKQREEVYRIQDEYQPKIEALQRQLDALKKERDAKISALLSVEQKKHIEEAAAKAKANRKSKRQSATKPAKPAPATPPAAHSPRLKAPASRNADYVSRSDTTRLRPSSIMSILSSRASQPKACITLSRGSPIALISLAIVMEPFPERVHQTTPAVSPIDATHEAEDVVVIWPPRYHDGFWKPMKNTTRGNYSQTGQVCKV